MSNKIKTNFEFPRGDDLQKQGQRLAQDLSLSMKAIKAELEKTTNSSFVSGTYSDITLTFTSAGTQTASHGLGITPTGWMVIDATNSASASIVYPVRTAWDSSTISIYFSTGSTVDLKIRVFI